MSTLISKVLIVALGLLVAERFVPGVEIDTLPTALLAGLVLGFCNAVVRPILLILTLPVTILTLGLFVLVINTAMVGLAAFVVPGFVVAGALAAFLVSLTVSLVSVVADRLAVSS